MDSRVSSCQASPVSPRAVWMCVLCTGGLTGVAVLAACHHSSSGGASDGGGSGADEWCRPAPRPGPTGTPVQQSPSPCTVASSIPPAIGTSSVSGVCNECTPRCDAEKVPYMGGGAFYTFYDLPTGGCETEGEICDMAGSAVQTCNGDTHGCGINSYRCTCTSGQWSCVMLSPGGGICGPCSQSTDAGAD